MDGNNKRPELLICLQILLFSIEIQYYIASDNDRLHEKKNKYIKILNIIWEPFRHRDESVKKSLFL